MPSSSRSMSLSVSPESSALFCRLSNWRLAGIAGSRVHGGVGGVGKGCSVARQSSALFRRLSNWRLDGIAVSRVPGGVGGVGKGCSATGPSGTRRLGMLVSGDGVVRGCGIVYSEDEDALMCVVDLIDEGCSVADLCCVDQHIP